jgi:hypothetical protein
VIAPTRHQAGSPQRMIRAQYLSMNRIAEAV